MHELDLRLFAALYGGPRGPLGAEMTALTWIGGGWAVLGIAVLFALPGRPRTRAFAAVLGAAVATQAVAVWALKIAAGRVRPWIAMNLPPPTGAPRDFSFPSGHAAGSFCVACFLAVALPAAFPALPVRTRAAGTAAIVVAALIGVSRVYLGAHFPGDVLAGAALGAAVGAAAGRLYAGARTREA